MNNLLVSFLQSGNGYFTSFLDLSSLIVIFSGIAVLVIKNPIGSLIALIAVYGFVSIILMFTGLTFIGFSYIIVYIGAVSILFLFILMLIDIRTSELQINNWNSIPLASVIAIFLNFALVEGLPEVVNSFDNIKETVISGIRKIFSSNDVISSVTSTKHLDVLYVTSNNWDGNITETSHISGIGNILYTSYNMWLFMTSIILLLAMVGAIVITIKNK